MWRWKWIRPQICHKLHIDLIVRSKLMTQWRWCHWSTSVCPQTKQSPLLWLFHSNTTRRPRFHWYRVRHYKAKTEKETVENSYTSAVCRLPPGRPPTSISHLTTMSHNSLSIGFRSSVEKNAGYNHASFGIAPNVSLLMRQIHLQSQTQSIRTVADDIGTELTSCYTKQRPSIPSTSAKTTKL